MDKTLAANCVRCWSGFDPTIENSRYCENCTIQNNELNLKCEDCGKVSSDVEETTCPYNKELNGIIVPCVICKDCYHERCMDI